MLEQSIFPAEPVAETGGQADSEIESRYGLVKTVAYVPRTGSYVKRAGVAERVARYRERLREKGLQSAQIPAQAAQALKEVGSWEALVDTYRDLPFSTKEKRALEIGRRVQALPEFRRVVILQWIGLKDVPEFLDGVD